MFLVQSAHETDRRAELLEEWWPLVDAPVHGLEVLVRSPHRPREQPDEAVDYTVDAVLAETPRR
ncbi:MAG TPA: hypothetical protein VM754_13595 [Actinomycetota bacterium]|nr:hypothetical protein [Actinomycetota bacterium]